MYLKSILTFLTIVQSRLPPQELFPPTEQEFFPANHLEVFSLPSEQFKRFFYNNTKLYSFDQLSIFNEPTVEEIHVKFNKNLLIIRKYAFTKLQSLKSLFITNNQHLAVLEPEFLYDAQNLEYLDLSNNNLKTIGYDVLQHIDRNVRLYISGNPFHCDCHIPNELLIRADSYNNEAMKCASPDKMVGKDIGIVSSLGRECEPYSITNFNNPGFEISRRVYLLCYLVGGNNDYKVKLDLPTPDMIGSNVQELNFGSQGNILNVTLVRGDYKCEIYKKDQKMISSDGVLNVMKAAQSQTDTTYIMMKNSVNNLDITHYEFTNSPRLNAIAAFAFTDLPLLKVVNLSGNEKLQFISKYAFKNNVPKLETLVLKDTGLGKHISRAAFENLFNLRTIGLPVGNFQINEFDDDMMEQGSGEDEMSLSLIPKHIYLDDYVEKLTLSEGQNFVMDCFQYGANLVSYKFNERVLPENPPDGLLIINAVSKHNEGMYACEILPRTGADSIKRVFLRIGEPNTATGGYYPTPGFSPINENDEVFVTIPEDPSVAAFNPNSASKLISGLIIFISLYLF